MNHAATTLEVGGAGADSDTRGARACAPWRSVTPAARYRRGAHHGHFSSAHARDAPDRARRNRSVLSERGAGLLRGVVEVLGGGDGEARVSDDGLALLDVGALEAHDEGNLEANLLGGLDHL